MCVTAGSKQLKASQRNHGLGWEWSPFEPTRVHPHTYTTNTAQRTLDTLHMVCRRMYTHTHQKVHEHPENAMSQSTGQTAHEAKTRCILKWRSHINCIPNITSRSHITSPGDQCVSPVSTCLSSSPPIKLPGLGCLQANLLQITIQNRYQCCCETGICSHMYSTWLVA